MLKSGAAAGPNENDETPVVGASGMKPNRIQYVVSAGRSASKGSIASPGANITRFKLIRVVRKTDRALMSLIHPGSDRRGVSRLAWITVVASSLRTRAA